MSLSSGFFNSVDHDRLYNAEDMSRLFDGLIRDGVFASIGTCMVVKANTKMTVNVGIGRAWFNHTWTLNDAIMPVTLEQSHVLWNRIDAVVIEVNSEENVRQNSIKVIQGEPSTNPVKPTLTKSVLVNQYPLAYITVPAAATAIRQADIENTVGTTECPFVSGILEVISIDQLIPQWKDILNRFVEENTANFNTWMNNEKKAYAQWLQSNKDDYNKLVKDQTTSYQTWFDGIKNNYANWFASIKEAYDANWEAFQQWESDSKSDYTAWFDGVKSTYDANWKEFQAWEKKTKDDFDAWYETIKNQLSGDVVAKLNDRIDQLDAKMLSLIYASGGIVEGTVEAPILLASADILNDGYDIISAGPKLLTGVMSKYPGTAHNGGAYDATTQVVTFGSEDNSGAYLTLDKHIHLKSSGEYTLSVDVEASAAISGVTIGVEGTGFNKYVTSLTAGKSTQTFDFTYSGAKLSFVCYATGMSGKTVKLSNMKILRNGVTEDNYGLYQNTNSVHIGPDTKFPLYGLRSYNGNTTIVSAKNFEAYVVDQYNGKALLESAKLGVEAKRDKVGLIKSNDRYLPNTNESPLMVAGATRNLLEPTLVSITRNGITCTNEYNRSNTYIFNGTATAEAVFDFITDEKSKLLYKNVVGKTLKFLDGGFGRNPNGRVLLNIRDANGNWWPRGEIYDGDVFEVIEGYEAINVSIRIPEGKTLSNVHIKPMLTTDLDATHGNFVPYDGYSIDACCRNLCPPISTGFPGQFDVKVTNDENGSHVVGNTITFEDISIMLFNRQRLPKGTYKFTGTPSGIDTSKYDVGLYVSHVGPNNTIVYDAICKDADGVTFTIDDSTYAYDNGLSGYLEIKKTDTKLPIDILFKPMITRDLTATYDTFEPYKSSSVYIDSTTEFPLLDLKTFDGETNIISAANFEIYHPDNAAGKELLEMIKKSAESGSNITYSVVGPHKPKDGDLWIDPSAGGLIRAWNGAIWTIPKANDRMGSDVIKSNTKPRQGRGALWIDETNDNTMKYVDESGNVTELASGGVSVGATAPSNTKLLWIDTSSGGVSKYYNGNAWVATASVWG